MDSGGIDSPVCQVAVVGGGITGLAAAYHLTASAKRGNHLIETTVFESASRTGGVIKTVRDGELVFEEGPDSIITARPAALALIEKLGMSGRLVSTNKRFRSAFVARGRKLIPLPEGFRLIVPGNLRAFAASPILSLEGKLRLLLDLVLPRHKEMALAGGLPEWFDESLASFVTRRFGKEALVRVAQPVIGGIYTADPSSLSLRATMPQFLEWEARYKSVIRGMKRSSAGASSESEAVRYGMFVSLGGGLSDLTNRLASEIGAENVNLNSEVKSVTKEESRFVLSMSDGSQKTADAVILAVPSFKAAELLAPSHPQLANLLRSIRYASSVVINLVFDRKKIRHPLDGFGFVVPAVENRTTIACSFASVKYENRAPSEKVVLRVFAGGALRQVDVDLSDEQLLDRVLCDLEELVGVEGAPERYLVSRWPFSMPQYDVGHLKLVEELENMALELPGLYLAGNAYRGVGIPDCIGSGEKASLKAIDFLSRRRIIYH